MTVPARRSRALLLGVAALLLLVLVPGVRPAARAQQEPEATAGSQAGTDPEGAAAAEEDDEATEEGEEGLEGIDELLEGEEEILAGEGYSYDPGTRRDPFKSLLAATELPEYRGPRPEGIPGLLIDEVILTGIFKTETGFTAQVQSAENEKSYLLRQGDQLYDGDVVRITDNQVIFKQIVQDPTALKPFREVVKTLNPERG
ncbi:MAG: hypothetical protein PVG07_10870 [Acidobacteriota bacterium]|jgi:Tfp pilus assembly protein PilP